MENKESFNYTYSSIHKEEIEKIRNKYIQNQESDLDELRKLDQKVTNTATFGSIVVGIVGLLVNKIITKKLREKYGPRILELSERLLKE
ncbi:MAG: hypothetical protein IKK80_07790 [Treponema sp.]|nr:hypothetical protein [Treponema sp.]